MTSKPCLIVSIARKHRLHANIVAQLQATGYAVQEIALPQENSGECSVKAEIAASLDGLHLIVVYLTNDVAANVCIGVVLREAEKRGIRVVSLWLDDEISASVPAPLDSFSDAVTPYADDLADVFTGAANPWVLSDGTEPPKRKIRKHTCG